MENLLLDSSTNIKIIDFGFSICIPSDKKLKIFCGTPSYMAPEIVTKREYAGPPADIWSLGILLFALLTGYFPFKGIYNIYIYIIYIYIGNSDKELFGKISNGTFNIPAYINQSARRLLYKMLSRDPNKRPTSKEILNDPFLTGALSENSPKEKLLMSHNLSTGIHGTKLNFDSCPKKPTVAQNPAISANIKTIAILGGVGANLRNGNYRNKDGRILKSESDGEMLGKIYKENDKHIIDNIVLHTYIHIYIYI